MLKSYPDILTVQEVMEILCFGKNKVYSLLSSGTLKGIRIGRTWRISKESLKIFFQEQL